MVDPVTIISLTASLVDIGTKLAVKLKNFVHDFRDAPSDIDRVWDELSSLCLILGRVETMLGDGSTSNSPFTPEAVADLRILLDHTMKVFIQFETFVNDFSTQGNGGQPSGGYQQGQWALAERHITNFRDRLETHKASLNISLQLGTLLATANIAQAVGNIQTNTEITNIELAKLRAMCQELLDREKTVARGGLVDTDDLPGSSETSSIILTYIERTELFAEELIAPVLQPSTPTQAEEPDNTTPERPLLLSTAEPSFENLQSHSQGASLFPTTGLPDCDTLPTKAENEKTQTATNKPLGTDAALFDRDLKSDAFGLSTCHLVGHWQTTNKSLVEAASSGDRATVERLIMSGADLGSRLGTNRTALQEAARNGHIAIVRILLESYGSLDVPSSLDARAPGDATALQLAALNGHNHIIQLLIDHGADVNASPGCFGTAMEAARTASTFDLLNQTRPTRPTRPKHPTRPIHNRTYSHQYTGRRGAVGNELLRQTFGSLIRLVGRLCSCT